MCIPVADICGKLKKTGLLKVLIHSMEIEELFAHGNITFSLIVWLSAMIRVFLLQGKLDGHSLSDFYQHLPAVNKSFINT